MYLDHNSASLFRTPMDSVRIYAPLLKFLASSFTAFLVDTVLFLLLAANFGLIWALEGAGLLALPAKMLAGIILLGISFVVQQRFLFTGKAAKKAAGSGPSEPSARTHISG